mmetsp:Transcript_17335/g.30926  ORF Transcript_17335/g.30926 Transcript_17335/m.30926 type:complete len:327 (+) Transcript_17335:1798-2778(+)
MGVDSHVRPDVEVPGAEVLTGGQPIRPHLLDQLALQELAPNNPGVALGWFEDGDCVVRQVVCEHELADVVASIGSCKLQLELELVIGMLHVLFHVPLWRLQHQVLPGAQGILLRPVPVVRGGLRHHLRLPRLADIDGREIGVAELLRQELLCEVIDVVDQEVAVVHVDGPANHQVLVRDVLHALLLEGQGGPGVVVLAIPCLGDLSTLHEGREGIAASVGGQSLGDITAAIRQEVMENEQSDVPIQGVAVVPDAEKPQHLPIILEELFGGCNLLRRELCLTSSRGLVVIHVLSTLRLLWHHLGTCLLPDGGVLVIREGFGFGHLKT